MEKKEIELEVLKMGYTNLRWVKCEEGELLCGLYRFIFTTGLVIGIDEEGYTGRYCFSERADAIETLNNLKEIPKNLRDLPGEWIKFKGINEFRNEKITTFVS